MKYKKFDEGVCKNPNSLPFNCPEPLVLYDNLLIYSENHSQDLCPDSLLIAEYPELSEPPINCFPSQSHDEFTMILDHIDTSYPLINENGQENNSDSFNLAHAWQQTAEHSAIKCSLQGNFHQNSPFLNEIVSDSFLVHCTHEEVSPLTYTQNESSWLTALLQDIKSSEEQNAAYDQTLKKSVPENKSSITYLIHKENLTDEMMKNDCSKNRYSFFNENRLAIKENQESKKPKLTF